MTTPVDVVSLYGPRNAGVRARMLSFLERSRVPYRLTSYFGGTTAGVGEFLRQPTDALRGEFALRRLSRRRTDHLIVSREASPLSKGKIESSLLRAGRHNVYDIDDALHHDVRRRTFETFFSKRDKAERSAAAADVVIAGNDYLANWASTYASDVRVIPTCVEPEEYEVKSHFEIAAAPRLVWLGTPSGERYLRDIEPALLRFHAATAARLTIIGSRQRSLAKLEPMIDRIDWELALVQQTLRRYDIGLMPLADTPYERGKCAYKLLEYAAAGLPAIVSPIGVNADIAVASGCYAPTDSQEWYEALTDAVLAPASIRRSVANRLNQTVRESFAFQRWLAPWRSAVGLD